MVQNFTNLSSPYANKIHVPIDLIKSSHQHTVGDTLWNNFELVGCHLLPKLNGVSTLGVELNGSSTLGLDGI